MPSDSQNIKAVIDLALVGMGHAEPALRTGVFRYAYELTLALTRREDVTIEFCASRDFQQAQRAIGEITELRGMPIVRPSYLHLRQSLTPLLESGRTSLPKPSAKLSRIDVMLLHASLHSLQRIVPKFAPTIAPQSLAGANVYHSPWFAIPRDLPRKKRLHRFLSLMDLIPIRFPYFFEANEEIDLRKKISSLDPEDFVLCISSSTREDLLNFRPKLDPAKVLVTHPGVSEKFTPVPDSEAVASVTSKIGLPPGCRYILSLCTLEPRKNLGLLLKAFAELRTEGAADDVFVVLAGGEGWHLDKLSKDLEDAKGIRERILMPGRIADEDLPALYSGATAFAYPSLYEGFGLPPLEAMRCGVPVVVCRTSSLPEVVGEHGLYCDPKDPGSLAEALRRLLDDPEFARKLGESGRQWAGQFTWEACADSTVAAYSLATQT